MNAEALVNTLRFVNFIYFGLRGGDEHWQMTWGEVKLVRDMGGTGYLEHSQWQTKTRTGAERRDISQANQGGSDERKPVFVYEINREKRPPKPLSILVSTIQIILVNGGFKDKCIGGKQTELVNGNYGKQSWTRREAAAHKPQRKKNDDRKI